MSTPQSRVDDAFPSTSGAMPGLAWWTGEAWSTLRLREEPSCEFIREADRRSAAVNSA